jgi:thiamine biosynthesis protein ThiI
MKLVLLISGGIDSPVAGYLMLKKGAELIAVHMDNRPYNDERQVLKSMSLIDQLQKVCNTKIKKYIIHHGETQRSFSEKCKRNLQCVLCKRMMLRTAEKIAELENATGIVTGEALGQVASQTIKNLKVENQAVDMPIIRPLIGLDKIEIVRIAKNIGTYEISIEPSQCCTIVPNKPSTHANLRTVIAEETKTNIDSMLQRSIDNFKIYGQE